MFTFVLQYSGLGHYNCTERLTLVGGDIKGERIVQISSKSDTVLAVSGCCLYYVLICSGLFFVFIEHLCQSSIH